MLLVAQNTDTLAAERQAINDATSRALSQATPALVEPSVQLGALQTLSTQTADRFRRFQDRQNTRLIAAEDDVPPAESNNSLYSYSYRGIYVIADGQQQRLFDYVDELNGQEEVEMIDVDNDGDTDALYFIGNSVYLKNSYQNTPATQQINTDAISDRDLLEDL